MAFHQLCTQLKKYSNLFQNEIKNVTFELNLILRSNPGI